jgi:hypothetical protein
MLGALEEYSSQNKLEINTDKVTIFNKTGILLRINYYLNGVQLENVPSYKYLGFLLTPLVEQIGAPTVHFRREV